MRETFLPYCRPDVGEREIAAVADSVRNGWLTTGPKVREFERTFAERAGVAHAVAVNSCTAALHVGLIAAGVGLGDEVVMPALSFVAAAQCTREAGAMPVFCDVDAATLSATLDTIAAAITPRTKAIVTLGYGGRPQGIDRIVEYARARGIAVIEDAAHAVGTLDRGKWAGTSSTLAAYSFYATKNLTTAEGGMLLTDDEDVANRVRMLSLHGMDRDAWKRYTQRGSWRYDVREPGFKYNLPDIAAAIGIEQLARLDAMQMRREEIAAYYDRALADIDGIERQAPPTDPLDRHSWCMYVVRVDEARFGISRDDLIERLKERNIGTSVHYIPTHHFSGYRECADSERLAVTDRVWREIVSLPLYPGMSDVDAADVVEAVRACARYSERVLAR